jgi:hypothetical protein
VRRSDSVVVRLFAQVADHSGTIQAVHWAHCRKAAELAKHVTVEQVTHRKRVV